MKKNRLLMMAVIFTGLLSGCTGINVTPEYIEWAQKVCEGNGGLKTIKVWGALFPSAYCENGAKFSGTSDDFKAG